MKKILSTILISSISIPLFASALEPLVRAGQEPQRRAENIEARRLNASTTRPRLSSSTKETGFCSQIDKALVQIGNISTTAGEKRVGNIEKREEKRDNKRSEVDTKRDENETKRKAQLAELTKRAVTDEQKAAVATFTLAVEKALVEKKSATDALLAAHRKEVDEAVSAHKATVEKALTTLKADIESAKNKAKDDCANNVSSESVRKALKDAILAAQQAFRATVQSAQKDARTKNLADKKNELKAIDEAFKKSIQEARDNLKRAFKASGTASSTTN